MDLCEDDTQRAGTEVTALLPALPHPEEGPEHLELCLESPRAEARNSCRLCAEQRHLVFWKPWAKQVGSLLRGFC